MIDDGPQWLMTPEQAKARQQVKAEASLPKVRAHFPGI
jgi:hypothetical protein